MDQFKRNNPGNIRYVAGQTWQGQVGQSGGFVIFDTVDSGLRAMAKLLSNYRKLYGLDSIAKIIPRYAPTSENNTAAYISFVAKKTGMNPNAQIAPTDYPAVAAAMIDMEQGGYPSSSTVNKLKSYFLSFMGGAAVPAIAGGALVAFLALVTIVAGKKARV